MLSLADRQIKDGFKRALTQPQSLLHLAALAIASDRLNGSSAWLTSAYPRVARQVGRPTQRTRSVSSRTA
jgi:hypothetical protein